MYTQCSQCQTTHRINARAISAAFGKVRCMHCGAVFSALDALADELGPDGRFPPQFHSEQPPSLRDEVPLDGAADDAGETSPPVVAAVKPEAPKTAGSNRWWALGALALLLGLVAQVGYGEREFLRTDPRTRPLLERYCERLGCEVALPGAVDQIALVSREIRPHPTVENALLITATIQNRAAFAQAYPQVGIALSDLENKVIAERFFSPRNYLKSGTSIDDGLPANTLLPIEFEVVDPGRNAVAFEFSFR